MPDEIAADVQLMRDGAPGSFHTGRLGLLVPTGKSRHPVGGRAS